MNIKTRALIVIGVILITALSILISFNLRMTTGKKSCKNNFRTLTIGLSNSYSVSWSNCVVPVWASCMSYQV